MTSEQILKALNRYKMSQRDLCGLTGMSPSTLCNFISGKTKLSDEKHQRIEAALAKNKVFSKADFVQLQAEYAEHCLQIVPSFASWLKDRNIQK